MARLTETHFHIQSIAEVMLHHLKSSGIQITPDIIEENINRAASAINYSLDSDFLQQLVEEIIRRFSFWIGRDTTLTDNDDHIDWLSADRKSNWKYWNRYQSYLEKKLSIPAVDALNRSTDHIIGLLEDPLREGAWSRYGLINGFVQSGKTGNYTGVVCKAADAGYKIIIVLAGLHNNLRAQTQIRLEEGFLGYETPINEETPLKLIGVGEYDTDRSIRPNCATNRTNNGDFNTKISKHLAVSPEQKPWLFVVKKNKTVLERLLKWIQSQVANSKTDDGRPIVTNLPVLIIDDETDNASVDTGEQIFDENGQPDEEHQPKTINRLIRRILFSFTKKAYLGYTATPFANIFIHRKGWTREEGPDLFPKSFIINLAAPSNYIGSSRMFGLRSLDGRSLGLPLIRDIQDHIEDECNEGWMPAKHKSSHMPLYKGCDTVPDSLREAIYAFVLACAARDLRGQSNQHSSMLIHVTRYTVVQGHVFRQVEREVTRLRQRIRYGLQTSEIETLLEKIWINDFVPTTLKLSTEQPDLVTVSELPTWSEIRERLPHTLDDIVVRAINGTAKDALDYSDNDKTGLKVIAIGGDKLARGLTLEGLCVSYFVRTTKMYDTLMQMGRWFGYRPNYLDLCRLYTSADLVEWFGHIADAAEELRQEFDTMAAIGNTPQDYGLRVQSHPVLLVTSPLKMRNSKPLQLSFSGELLETVAFHTQPSIIKSNLKATINLIEGMGSSFQSGIVRGHRNSTSWKGHLWQDIKPELIIDFFNEYTTHPGSRKVHSNLIAEFIKSMAETGELISWTVFLVGSGEGNEFKFTPNISVENTVKRENKSTSPDIYQIGRLLSPMHEAIDLDETQYQAAMKLTIEAKSDDSATTPPYPSGNAIRRIRGLGSEYCSGNTRKAVLLIYPLDQTSARIKSNSPVIGFGVSFPNSPSSVKVTYQVDHLLWEEEYGQAD